MANGLSKEETVKPFIYVVGEYSFIRDNAVLTDIEDMLDENPFISQYYSPRIGHGAWHGTPTRLLQEAAIAQMSAADYINVKEADVVVAIVDHSVPVEVGIALELEKKIVLINTYERNLSPILIDHATKEINDLEEFRDFNFLKLE